MYYGTKAALEVLTGAPECYLPQFWGYLDDIREPEVCPKIGELLAVEEFNKENEFRSVDEYCFLESERIFKNAGWIHQMHSVNIIDHPSRKHQRSISDFDL